jgi:hypothetical protein
MNPTQTVQPQDDAQEGYEMGGQILSQEEFEAKQKEMRDLLQQAFGKQRDEWVRYRAASGVEKRWRRAQEL